MVNITSVSHMTPLHMNDPFRATKVLRWCLVYPFPVCVQSQPIVKADKVLKLTND